MTPFRPDCTICGNTGLATTRDGTPDACGRCARLAEIDWQSRTRPARLRNERRSHPRHTAKTPTNCPVIRLTAPEPTGNSLARGEKIPA
jgi:hypothetical protein